MTQSSGWGNSGDYAAVHPVETVRRGASLERECEPRLELTASNFNSGKGLTEVNRLIQHLSLGLKKYSTSGVSPHVWA